MSIKVFNGLINLGGILTETYYRKTRATNEAKSELGLDLAKEYNASIGIASINEYVVLTKLNLAVNSTTIQNLAPFDQDFEIVNVQTSNLNSDQYGFGVLDSGGQPLYRYSVNKNLGFYPIRDIFVPKGGRLEIFAQAAIPSFTVVLKPCVVIANSIPVVPPTTP
jgi:hypothetical protein